MDGNAHTELTELRALAVMRLNEKRSQIEKALQFATAETGAKQELEGWIATLDARLAALAEDEPAMSTPHSDGSVH